MAHLGSSLGSLTLALGKLGGDDRLELPLQLRHKPREVLRQATPDQGRQHFCVVAEGELGVRAQHCLR